MVCENTVSNEYLNLYEKYNIEYIIIPNNSLTKIYKKEDPYRFSCTINKFYVYELTDYEKVCFLDTDLIIFKNIDFLFDEKPLPYVLLRIENEYDSLEFAGGLFIVKPKKDFFYNTILNYRNNQDDEHLLRKIYASENFYSQSVSIIYNYTLHKGRKPKYWFDYDTTNIFSMLIDLENLINMSNKFKREDIEKFYGW